MKYPMKLPNLIVAGTPKCGTTSFYSWLEAHPQVNGSQPKETHYFIDQNDPFLNSKFNFHSDGLNHYFSFFNASTDSKVFFEADPQYIYQETALNFFSACEPQPYIVFLLRKPSSQIFSNFSVFQNQAGLISKNISFGNYVDLLLDNNVKKIQKYIYSQRAFYVLDNLLKRNRYSNYLKLWKKRFDPDKIIVILFEEFVSNPYPFFNEISIKLNIDPAFYKHYNFNNARKTKQYKYLWLQRNLVNPFLSQVPEGKIRNRIRALYRTLQTSDIPSSKPDPKILHRLDKYFHPFNQELRNYFNLDLSSWD